MNGYSSHTYMWINAVGQKSWVKYHFISEQGVECLTQEEADVLVSSDGDYHTRDLFKAIERRAPQLDPQGADYGVRKRCDLPFQPLRPHQGLAACRLPVGEVGKMTLTEIRPITTLKWNSLR